MFIFISFSFLLLVVDCQLEIIEFLVIYIDDIERQRIAMLVLVGKLFLARLVSQAK